jgi:hypothetical protein
MRNRIAVKFQNLLSSKKLRLVREAFINQAKKGNNIATTN